MLKEYEGKIRFAVKFLPYQYRDFAFIAAEAALSARDEGKFWQMHWMLHENYPNLDRQSLIGYARRLKLNMKKFIKDIDELRHMDIIRRDLELAKKLDLYSTPSIFINGIKIVGRAPYEYYKGIIENELSHRH